MHIKVGGIYLVSVFTASRYVDRRLTVPLCAFYPADADPSRGCQSMGSAVSNVRLVPRSCIPSWFDCDRRTVRFMPPEPPTGCTHSRVSGNDDHAFLAPCLQPAARLQARVTACTKCGSMARRCGARTRSCCTASHTDSVKSNTTARFGCLHTCLCASQHLPRRLKAGAWSVIEPDYTRKVRNLLSGAADVLHCIKFVCGECRYMRSVTSCTVLRRTALLKSSPSATSTAARRTSTGRCTTSTSGAAQSRYKLFLAPRDPQLALKHATACQPTQARNARVLVAVYKPARPSETRSLDSGWTSSGWRRASAAAPHAPRRRRPHPCPRPRRRAAPISR